CRMKSRPGWASSPACSGSIQQELRPSPFAHPARNSRHEHRELPEGHHGATIMLTEKYSEIGTIAAIGPLGEPAYTKYDRLIAKARDAQAITTVVAHPCDETSLRGPIEAAESGIIVPILVGPRAKIASVAREHGLDIDRYEIVDAPHSEASAAKAV